MKELLNYFKYAIKEKDISENKIKLQNNDKTIEYFKNNNLEELISKNIDVLKYIYKLECNNLEINNIKNDNCIKKGKYE